MSTSLQILRTRHDHRFIPPPSHPYLGLVIATLAVSCSAIMIKESSSPPLVIAAYRLAITVALLLAPSCAWAVSPSCGA